MVWRCKVCGSEEFKISVVGTIEKYGVIFDKNGEVEDYKYADATNTTETLECTNCGNTGDFIDEIANLVRE